MLISNKLSAGKLDRVDLDTYKKLDKSNIILVLENIRSAINVGSIFRTADSFKVDKIFLCGITATPPNKEVLKSALGATESVEWEFRNNAVELINELKEQSNIKIISVEQTDKSIYLNKFIPETNKKLLLIFGNEINGVDQEIINSSHHCVEIPQFGTKHSLNVAVSAGIVLWDIYSKMNLKKV